MLIAQIFVILSLVLTLAINYLANSLPLNGQMTGEISDRFPIYFVPAGYVFAIWGVIYLALIAFTIYQALPAQAGDPVLNSIRWLFVLINIANAVWLVCWHYERFPLSLLVMVVILGLLLVLYTRLQVGSGIETGTSTYWLVQIPFSIYLGWISVATIANASQVLYHVGWGGFGLAPELWAAIMLVVALTLGILMRQQYGDVAYGLVLIWAFVGIAQKHAGVPLVMYSAWGSTGLMGLWLVLKLFI